MNSALDQIFSKFNEKKDTASWVISKELLKIYEDGFEVPNIKNLSKQCFVSPAMITKFSKQLGFQGYKELSTKIKIEKSDRQHKGLLKNIKRDSSGIFDIVKNDCISTIEEFNFIEMKINSLCDSILNSKNIYIFSSHNFVNQAKKIHELLLFKNFSSVFFETTVYSIKSLKNISKNDFVIFFMGGQDTKTIEFLFNDLIKLNPNQKFMLFMTHSKKYKFEYPLNSIVVDSNHLTHQNFERDFIFSYIYLQFINKMIF